MFTILDTLKVGELLSITVKGNCENLKNGSSLRDHFGNIYNVVSIGMMQLNNPHDISNITSLLISPATLKKGEELFLLT